MKLNRQGKISFLQPSWARKGGVAAGFTTRNGGVSRPPYNSLNLGTNTQDPRPNVEANRATLTRAFDLPPHRLLTVSQEHGSSILVLREPNPDVSHFQRVACDAVLINQPGLLVGILVADCYPVLLYHPELRVAGAVHVGWRGAAAGLIAKSVAALEKEFGAPAAELVAAIGPGIGAHSYEVDRPVRDAFRQGAGGWDEVAEEVGLGKWRLDLERCCRLQLEKAGLPAGQIQAAAPCTCCHREMFFSYRRDQGETGRQMGFILIEENGA